MKKCNVALDGHKEYTWAAGETRTGQIVAEGRIDHRRGAIREYLARNFAKGSHVAVETTGCYYWIVDEIEEAGMVPQLVNARKAKARLAETNHSDQLDVRGLLMLMAIGKLPTVWMYVEAGNAVCMNRSRWPERTAAQLYERAKKTRGHGRAIIAVGRHLAESTYWILTKREPYCDRPARIRPAGTATKGCILRP